MKYNIHLILDWLQEKFMLTRKEYVFIFCIDVYKKYISSTHVTVYTFSKSACTCLFLFQSDREQACWLCHGWPCAWFLWLVFPLYQQWRPKYTYSWIAQTWPQEHIKSFNCSGYPRNAWVCVFKACKFFFIVGDGMTSTVLNSQSHFVLRALGYLPS